MRRAYRLTGVSLLTLGPLGLLLAWRVLDGPGERMAGQMFADVLLETRTRAIHSGRPHRLVLTKTTMEIREEADDRILRRDSIPGATLLSGPDWIRIDSTGSAQFPGSFHGGLRADTGWNWPRPTPQGDVVFSLAGGPRFLAMFVDLASGRVDRFHWLADDADPGLLAQLRATLSP